MSEINQPWLPSTRSDAFLDRLLCLTHQRYEEEVTTGVRYEGAKKAASKEKRAETTARQGELIKPPQQELLG